MKEQISEALIYYHFKNIEWVSLKEIYDKVEEMRRTPNVNNGASIRRTLETHTKASKVFDGEELYISKGLGTGLYKSIHYDRIRIINNFSIGDIFTREQLMNIFKISGQSGMMKTNLLNALVLTTSEDNGIYGDTGIENGTIQYTGEGQIGDQTITKNNKTLYYSKRNNIPVYLFSKDKKRRYIFEGKVELYDKPYQMPENDINGKDRLVYKFPLRVIYSEKEYKDKNIEKITHEIIQISNDIEINGIKGIIPLKEGPLEIRKYRKLEEKREISRTHKPDYIAEEIVKTKNGMISEKSIYEEELQKMMEKEADEQVKQMEDFFNNRKDNEGYDILSFELDENGEYIKKYIEVKSTKGGEGTPIDITDNEYEFMKDNPDNYYIYRIIYSESPNRYKKIIRGRDLIDNYEFVSTAYKIYSK